MRWFRRPRDLSCQQVAELLQTVLDAEVPDGTAQQVQVHLGDCQHCGIEYELYEDIKRTLVRRCGTSVDPAVLQGLRQFCDDLSRQGPSPADRAW